MIADARAAAVSRQPLATASPPRELVWKTDSLTLAFDDVVSSGLPDWSADAQKAPRARVIAAVFDLFKSLSASQRLLDDIAAFPEGIVVGADQELDDENRRKLRPVSHIGVTFWLGPLPIASTDGDTLGHFNPEGRSDRYTISVQLLNQDAPPGDKYWPCPPTKQNPCLAVRYAHKRAVSRMASLVAHELVHIWFTYKFSLLDLGGGGTGHGTYSKACSMSFFDPVEAQAGPMWPGGPAYPQGLSAPFFERLKYFYRQLDEKERAAQAR